MAISSKFGLQGKARGTYLQLVTDFPLASIKSDEHLAEAQDMMDRLFAEGAIGDGTELYLDALSDLVGAYEDSHHSIEFASDADMLQHLLDTKGITQSQLSREAGFPKSSVSEVLSGKKPFSRVMIRKLSEYFGVDVRVLAGNL